MWSPDSDSFSFNGLSLSADVVITKCVILSCIARIFYPLGFLSPVAMSAKCLFQELWAMGIDWDQEVLVEKAVHFQQWVAELEVLKTWKIPRQFIAVPWITCLQCGLHLQVFCDASQIGYGAVVYAGVETDGGVNSTLIMSKAKVAPLKRLMLSRLELMGCLIGAHLAAYLKKTLGLDSVGYLLWTDSQTALSWIKGDPGRWKPFVAN